MKNFIFILLFIVACTAKENTKEDAIIAEIESEGYTYIGEAKMPAGIKDTLIWGYTDRINENFFNKTEKFNALKIKGYEFDKVSENRYKEKLMIYRFIFNDLNEKERFERFQKYILNYQQHSKNKVEFFQKKSEWLLRFEPMP